MKKILYYLPSIIFNVAEFSVLIIIGSLLKINFKTVLFLVLIFAIFRMIFKNPLHYKDWYRCLIWSTLFFLSLFVVAKFDLIICICLTVFEALILSGKGNISDIFQWGGNALNNEVFNWVKFNQNNERLIKYESDLKKTDGQKYAIFKYRFREFRSYNDIADLMELPTQRISDELKIMSHFIEYSIRLDD